MKSRPVVMLMLILTACYAVGFVGSVATNAGLSFAYIVFNKPVWAIPGWLFVPVWTVMYGLMAVAAWHVWKSDTSRHRTTGLILFSLQLLLSAAWPWVFFGIANHIVGIVAAIFFWLPTCCAWVAFKRVNEAAGRLMIAPLFWGAYLTALSTAVWWMNR